MTVCVVQFSSPRRKLVAEFAIGIASPNLYLSVEAAERRVWVGLALLWRRGANVATVQATRRGIACADGPPQCGTSLEAVRGETARLAHLSLWPARDRARWRGSDRSPLKQRNSLLPSYPVEAAERSERGRGLRWRPLFFCFFLLFVYYKIVFFVWRKV